MCICRVVHARADLDATSCPDAGAAEAGLERVRAYVESCASYERTSGGETYASSTLTPFDVEVDGADAALGYAEKQADGFRVWGTGFAGTDR